MNTSRGIATATELQYFQELYRLGHLTRAAARLGVTQPTLTQSLMRLEQRVGSRLFERSRKGMHPTRQGRLFFDESSKLLRLWSEIEQKLKKNSIELAGEFVFGCHPSVGLYFLPSFMASLRKKAPKISLKLRHDLSRKVTDLIIAHELDFGVVINPVRHPDLVLVPLARDEVTYFVSGASNEDHQKLFVNPELNQTHEVLKKTPAKVLSQFDLVECTSLDVMQLLTQSGEGAGILPARVAGPKCKRLSSELPVYHDRIFLVFKPELTQFLAGKTLIELAKQVLT